MSHSVMAALLDYLEADTPGKRRACIATHPELLDPPVDAILLDLIGEARQAGQTDIAEKLYECRTDLAGARAAGIAAGRPARPGPSGLAIPAEAGPLLAKLRQLGPTADAQQRIEILRPLVRLIDPGTHCELSAALQGALGNALAELGDGAGAGGDDEAIAAFEAAQELLSAAPISRQRRINAHQLGRIYARRRTGDPGDNLEAAIKQLTEAVGTGEEQLPPRSWAGAQADLAEAYMRRLAGQRSENIECAIRHLQAAAEVFTEQEFPAEWAELLCSLGIALRERLEGPRTDNLDRAIRYCQQVRGAKARRRWPEIYARACNGLGTAYLAMPGDSREDNVERAIGYYREAAEILATRGRTAELAAVQHNLGNAYLDRVAGNASYNVEAAISCLEDALTMRSEEAFPPDWAATRQGLGNAFLQRIRGERAHNVEEALVAFQDAERVFARVRAARERALTLVGLAQGYFERVIGPREDNVMQAVSCLQAAVPVFSAEGMLVEHAMALTGLGNVVSERAAQDHATALQSAIGYHKEALHVLRRRATSPAAWSFVQGNLGVAYLESHTATRSGDLGSALACFEEALDAGATACSPLQQAMTRHNLGVAHVARGDAQFSDLSAAIPQFKAALVIFTAVGSAHHKRACGQALGDAYARLERWSEASRAYAVALNAADDIYVSSLRLDTREAELVEARGLHSRAAFAAASDGDLEQAVTILERGRARGLGEALARDAAELAQIREQNARLADTFLTAAGELRDLEAMDLRSSAGAGGLGARLTEPLGVGRGRDDALRQALDAARTRLNEAVRQIRRLKGHDRFLMQLGFGDVAAVVDKAGPVAYLAVNDAGSLTLLIAKPDDTAKTGHKGQRRVALVSQAEEPLTYEGLSALLIDRGDGDAVTGGYLPGQMAVEDSPGEFIDALEELLPVLGERLIAPLAEKLSERRADGVTLIACGLLGLLPLHAAPYRRAGTLRCLLDDCTVSYAPSARVLGVAHARLSDRSARVPALAGAGDIATGQGLPFARAELEEISTRFQASTILYGSDATKSALLRAAHGATHIHFACHGLFDPVTPRESALVLAGREEPGLLTLREITTIRPFADARLVVASACETAFTDFIDLPDETIGLPAGFLQAGTPAVIGTLWPVLDISTALLMVRFYEYLLGFEGRLEGTPLLPAQALRQAQLWLARVSRAELEEYLSRHRALSEARGQIPVRRQPFGHAYYWAPFVLVGA